MQLLNSYSADKYGLQSFLKSIDSKSIYSLIYVKYEDSLKDTVNRFAEQIENFDVDNYLNTLTLEDIYLILGLNLKDYLRVISIYASNIIISDIVDDKFSTYDIIN